jgi:hypothetical protein
MKNILFPVLFVFLFQSGLIAQEKSTITTDDNEKGMTGPLCGGVERWSVKVLTDASASLVNYTPKLTTLDSLVHIATSPNASAPRMAGIEFQAYTITCKITIKKNEDDSDYHLVLQDSTETMVGEVPNPVCAVAASSTHVDEYIAARNWVNMNIGILPNSGVNLPPLKVTGVAFVDVPHGQTGAAPNQMEIHPILNIQLASSNGINDQNNGIPPYQVTVSPSIFTESAVFHITSIHEMFGKCRLELYSMSGDKMRDLSLPVSGSREVTYTFHRDGLSSGMYIYRILNNGEILYEGKVVIL